jgi:CBS domain-containing protein
MSGDLLVADASWPIGRLVEFLATHGISGAPVVSADGLLVGVVSLTDIAKRAGALSRRRPHSHAHDYYVYGPTLSIAMNRRPGLDPALTVADIMTPAVFDVPVTATVQEIAQTMLREGIHRVFVTESGMVIGVITAFDLLRVLT